MTTGTRHGYSAMPGMARERLASESLSVTFKLMPSLAKMMTIGIASGKRASALTKEEMVPMLRLCQALTRLATPTLYAVASADRTPLTAQSTPILTTSASGRCSPPCPTTIVLARPVGLGSWFRLQWRAHSLGIGYSAKWPTHMCQWPTAQQPLVAEMPNLYSAGHSLYCTAPCGMWCRRRVLSDSHRGTRA